MNIWIIWFTFFIIFVVYIILRLLLTNSFTFRFRKYKKRKPVAICTSCGLDNRVKDMDRPYIYKKWCNACGRPTTHVRVFLHYSPNNRLFIEIPILENMGFDGPNWSTRAIKILDMDDYLKITSKLSDLFKETNSKFLRGKWE